MIIALYTWADMYLDQNNSPFTVTDLSTDCIFHIILVKFKNFVDAQIRLTVNASMSGSY